MNVNRDPAARMLLAVDASVPSRSMLETALKLAAGARKPLSVLIVEDSDLMALAKLPLAAEVAWFSEMPRAFGVSEAARMLRVQTTKARRSLNQLADAHGVQCTVKVVQGRFVSQVLSEVPAHDLVLFGARTVTIEPTLPATRSATAASAHSQAEPRASIVLAFDGSPLDKRVLLAAAGLAESLSLELRVFLTAMSQPRDAAVAAAHSVLQVLERPPEISFEPEPPEDVRAALLNLRPRDCRFVVCHRDQRIAGSDSIDDLVNGIRNPIAMLS